MGVDYSTAAGFGFTLTPDEVYAASVNLGVAPSLEAAQEEFASEELDAVLQEINKRMKKRYPNDKSGLRAGYFVAGSMYSARVEDVYVVTAGALNVDEEDRSYHKSMSLNEAADTVGFLTEVTELLGVNKSFEFHVGLHVY